MSRVDNALQALELTLYVLEDQAETLDASKPRTDFQRGQVAGLSMATRSVARYVKLLKDAMEAGEDA